MAGIEVVDVAHAIELAVAPVFLLSGVGVIRGRSPFSSPGD